MIPYFQYNAFQIGPIVIQVWGLMVALGIMAAVLLMDQLAKKLVLSREVLLDLAIWILVSGFIFARVFHVVFYNLDFYLRYPAEAIAFWHGGASSLGGLFGAALAVYLFAKARKFSWPELAPYLDITAFSLWLGWGIGRLGCFLIHDHPGKLASFFLAVNFPAGARHDLGLYDSLLAFGIFIIFALLFRRLIRQRWGLISGLSLAVYAVVRFFLDFLRAADLEQSDVRYFSLTPAQWGMAALILALTGALVYGRVKRKTKIGRVA